MKFSKTYTLKEISEIIDVDFIGDENFPVLGMNEIHVVEEGDIVLWTIQSIMTRLCNPEQPLYLSIRK